eukprot:1143660-Pelagomonas_calceolata.AAC.4
MPRIPSGQCVWLQTRLVLACRRRGACSLGGISLGGNMLCWSSLTAPMPHFSHSCRVKQWAVGA